MPPLRSSACRCPAAHPAVLALGEGQARRRDGSPRVACPQPRASPSPAGQQPYSHPPTHPALIATYHPFSIHCNITATSTFFGAGGQRGGGADGQAGWLLSAAAALYKNEPLCPNWVACAEPRGPVMQACLPAVSPGSALRRGCLLAWLPPGLQYSPAQQRCTPACSALFLHLQRTLSDLMASSFCPALPYVHNCAYVKRV